LLLCTSDKKFAKPILEVYDLVLQLEKFVGEQNLLNSPEYLVSLLNIVDASEKPLIAGHLEELTKQSHGDDTSAWHKWLKSQK